MRRGIASYDVDSSCLPDCLPDSSAYEHTMGIVHSACNCDLRCAVFGHHKTVHIASGAIQLLASRLASGSLDSQHCLTLSAEISSPLRQVPEQTWWPTC